MSERIWGIPDDQSDCMKKYKKGRENMRGKTKRNKIRIWAAVVMILILLFGESNPGVSSGRVYAQINSQGREETVSDMIGLPPERVATETDAKQSMEIYNKIQQKGITGFSVDQVYDMRSIYYGNGGLTHAYSLNQNIQVYCGDHQKEAASSAGTPVQVSDAENSDLSARQKTDIRKVLYYSHTYSGFSGEDDRIVKTQLALDYFKNGNFHSYANDYIQYIKQAAPALSVNEALLYVTGTDAETVTSGTDTKTNIDAAVTTATPSGERLKQTKLLTIQAADGNSVSVTVPEGVTLWLYSYHASAGKTSYYESGGIKNYDKKITEGQKVILNARDQFLLTASIEQEGHSAFSKAYANQYGCNIMQCYHDDIHQTWYYTGEPERYSISIDIDWGKAETASLSLKKGSSNISVSSGTAYSLEGAVYDIYHVSRKTDSEWGNTGVRVGRFITNANGTGVVQTEFCKTDQGYHITASPLKGYLKNLPFGYYRIQEAKAPKGYALDKTCKMVDLSDGGTDGKADVVLTDYPVSARADIVLYKRDMETGENVQGKAGLSNAEFTIRYYGDYYDDISALPEKPDRTWVLKTDETGYCALTEKYLLAEQSDTLFYDQDMAVIPLGTLTIEETKAPEGYTLTEAVYRSISENMDAEDFYGIYMTQIVSDGETVRIEGGTEYEIRDEIIRGDLEFDKYDAETKQPLANVKFSITSKTTGESHIVWTDENGHYSTSAAYMPHTKNTNSEVPGSGVWFGNETPDDTKGALPYDTYTISELRCDANFEVYKTAEPVEVVISEDNVIVSGGAVANENFPEIRTTAKDAVTNDHTSSAAATVTLVDTVAMNGLDVGHEYVLTTTVMDKSTGKKLAVADGISTKDTPFIAEAKDMSLDVSVTFSSAGLAGKDVVFFETLTDAAYPGEVIARHENINDTDQTIHFVKIGTKASGKEGEKEMYSKETITLVDAVSFQGLTKGKTYTVSGVLMDKETGKEFLSGGKPVTGSTTFVADRTAGTIEVIFTFRGIYLKHKQIVVFEELHEEDYLLAVHADIHDDDQTIDILPIRGDLEFTKLNSEKKPVADVMFSITRKSTGESHIVWTDEKGYYSTEASYIKHSKGTNSDKPGAGVWFGDDKADDTKGALPYDTYVIRELRCEANKNTYKTAAPVEVVINENEVVAAAGTIIDEKFPEIHTTARDSVTNHQTSSAVVEEVTLIDTVIMTGLDPGHTYTLSTVVMDKETKEMLVAASGDVTAETTFTAERDSASIDIPVTFSSAGLEGKDVVFFEVLTDSAYPGETVSRHEDINDKDQTIHFVSIQTEATDDEGEKTICAGKDITLVDTVFYTGLTVGETYTVSGILMDKETGKPYLSDGKQVTAQTAFIPETESGSIEVQYTFSGIGLGEKQLVVFEELSYKDYSLAKHEDINDEGQTIQVYPTHTVISKKDAATGEELPGAVLSIYDGGGNLVESWISGTSPHEIVDLPVGSYRLVEEASPLGYLMSEEVIFDITDDGNPIRVEMYDDCTILSVLKCDYKTGKPLSGAEFTLYEAATGETVMSVSTNEDGIAEFLKVKPGDYFIRETLFPEGYTVSPENLQNCIYVTVEANQYTNPEIITISNITDEPDEPPTGDRFSMGLLSMILVISILIVLLILLRLRRYVK